MKKGITNGVGVDTGLSEYGKMTGTQSNPIDQTHTCIKESCASKGGKSFKIKEVK